MTFRKTCAALVLALAVAGCSGGSDDPEPSSASSTPGQELSGSSSETPSHTATVTPATGTAMTSDWLDLRLPADADWIITRNGRSGHHPGEDGTLSSVLLGSAGEGFDSLAEVTRTSLSVVRDSRPSARLGENRTVSGVEGITITAEDDRGYLYVFDTAVGGSEYSITFQLPVRDAASEAWIESILASVEWKVSTPAG